MPTFSIRPRNPSRRSAAPVPRPMPPQPEAFPNMPCESIPPAGRSACDLRPVGSSPTSPAHNAPVVAQLVAGSALAASPHLPHLRFESLDTLRRYSDPPFPVQSKAQELAFPDPPCPALGGVHLQSQMLLDPALNRRQRPFRRRLTAYVDIAVIRIPAERCPRRSSSLSSASR